MTRLLKFSTFLHASCAIDAKHLAVDPLAVLGGKEADDAGNIDGETDAVERGPSGRVLYLTCQQGFVNL